jgi:hypothetical protein
VFGKKTDDGIRLDDLTEQWLEETAKRSNPHKNIKLIFGGIWGISIVLAIFYVIFKVATGEEVIDGDTTYNTAIRETSVIVCLAYIFIVMAAVIIHYLIMNRIHNKIDLDTGASAEGIVYSSKVVGSGTTERNGRITGQTDRYEVLVAVKGFDKFLRARMKVMSIENGKTLQTPDWRRGVKVTVVYDRTRPKICRIVDTKVSRIELW